MTKEQQQWEEELKAAGWTPEAAHPNSPVWYAPTGFCGSTKRLAYPGPGYAHQVMKNEQ
jgi:hypothetical protein